MIKQTSLHHIKTMMEFDIEDTTKDSLISSIYNSMTQQILNYIGEKDIPDILDWLVVEVTIRRFNLIGVESNIQDTVSSLSTTYRLDPLTDFYIHLDCYMEKRDSKRRVRML